MERKWDASKYELLFEKYLTNNGYAFEVLKEYQSKTYYLISKDDYEMEYEFPLIQIKNMRKYFELFEKDFRTCKEFRDKFELLKDDK